MRVLLERGSGLHWAVALLLAGLLVSTGQSAWAAPEPHTLKGVVERFNHSPEGRYEGILLKSGDKLLQVNFPKHMAAEVTKAVAMGDQISVVVVAEDTKGDHPVYRLQKLTTAKGGEIAMEQKIEGVVKSLNYSRHGEVNGAVLDNGNFVHLGPKGAKLVKLASCRASAVSRPTYTRWLVARQRRLAGPQPVLRPLVLVGRVRPTAASICALRDDTACCVTLDGGSAPSRA